MVMYILDMQMFSNPLKRMRNGREDQYEEFQTKTYAVEMSGRRLRAADGRHTDGCRHACPGNSGRKRND